MRIALIGVLLIAAMPGGGSAQDAVSVRADDQPVWGDRPQLQRELRIGVVDGPEERSFGRIVGIAVSASGDLWVADAQATTIRRFDASGSYLGSVGRSGEGPGEFQALAGLQRTPDGRFAAWDARLKRVSYFDSSGEYVESVRVPAQFEVGSSLEAFRVGVNGELFVLGANVTPPDPVIQMFYMQLRGSDPPDTIRVPAYDPRGPVRGMRSYLVAAMYPFATMTYSALSPAGHLVIGRNDAYAIHSRTADGRPLRIERRYDPVAVQGAERRQLARLGAHFRRRNPSASETSTAVPRAKPPFWHLWVDHDQRIWVARHGRAVRRTEAPHERARREQFGNPLVEWWDPLAFDVIDRSGRFLGTLQFDNMRTRPMFAEGQRVWVLEEGEYGEQYVVRFLISRPT